MTAPSQNATALTLPPDWLHRLAERSQARLALGQAGGGMPTRALLAFGLDHARARDAVYAGLDGETLGAELARSGFDVLRVRSNAPDRESYLRRPDLGRGLAADAAIALEPARGRYDLVVVIADGLSAEATNSQAVPVLDALRARLPDAVRIGAVLAEQARVALGDPVCALLQAKAVLVLLGERPGLSSAHSLGAYLTYGPTSHTTDADRNCVSNIRPGGLDIPQAADKLAWLVTHALRDGRSGVALKEGAGPSADLLAP